MAQPALTDCPSCQTAVRRDANICPKCGEPIRRAVPGRPGLERSTNIAVLAMLIVLALTYIARH
jgi:predicted amidophosphoribosyltransferase